MNERIIYCLITSLILIIPATSYGQKSHGLEFDSRQYKSTAQRAFLINTESNQLPASTSLKQFCPKPLSQRMENTSTGWAAAYGARTILEAQKLGIKTIDEIKKICYSPVFNYHMAKPDHAEDCSALARLPDVLESMKTYGTPRYMDFRKSCPTEIPDDVFIKAYEHRIAEYFRIFDEDDNMTKKVDAVKISLANGSPVIVGMYTSPSFEVVKDQFWQPRETLDTESYPGHALVVVGYDDTKFTGSFEVFNSWGTDWGNEGFMWIRYKDFDEFVKYGYEIMTLKHSYEEKDFSGKVEIPLLDGEKMKFILDSEQDGFYKTTMKYEDFTTFNLLINSSEKSFIYVLGSDQTGEIYDGIFPYSGVSPTIPYKNHNLVVTELEMDDTPGSNYLCILFSQRAMSNTYLLDKLNEFKGKEFKDRIHIAFYDRIVPPEKINFASDMMEFKGTRGQKDLVPMIIEILHD